MANVIVDKNKIDLLANAISAKSGEPLTLTLDEMVEAVDGIETGGEPNLQAKTLTVSSAGTETVTADAGYDGLSGVEVSVPEGQIAVYVQGRQYYTENNARKWRVKAGGGVDTVEGDGSPGFIADGTWVESNYYTFNAVPTGTTITPSTSSQTIGGANYMMEGAVTVSAMPSGSVSAPASVVASNATVSVNASTGIVTLEKSNVGNPPTITAGYVSSATSTMSNVQIQGSLTMGTAGTPTATKSAVSNHSVTVTPSVTNTTGYITGSTKTGTAVTVTASELVSGTYNVSSSGSHDVTNYASASVPSQTLPTALQQTSSGTLRATIKSDKYNEQYLNIPAGYNDTAKFYTVLHQDIGTLSVTENGTYYAYMEDLDGYGTVTVNVSGGGGSTIQVGTKTATLSATASSISFTGLSGNPTSFVVTSSSDIATSTNGVTGVVWDGTNLHGQTMTTGVTADTGFSKSYSNGTLTITATTAEFQANEYKLVYTYSGTSSDIHTSDVQVGSGATSITFSSLSGRPIYWSCIFKSDFTTSSGYQRVIEVVNDGTSIYGMAMDSSAKAQTSWSATYSGGNLTISSTGTNNGGYFHQPGYYQLTYAVDASAPQYQTKSVSYTPSTTQQTATVYPDSGYDALESVSVTVSAMPSMTLPNSASATSSGTSKATITPTSSVQYLNIPTGYNATAQYYTIGASGGGGGSVSVATTTWNNSSNTTTSHQFTGLSGTPKFAVLRCTSQLTRSSSNTYYYIADIVWNGTNAYGNYHLRSNGSYNNVASDATTKFTVTTGTNSITFTSGGSRSGAPGSFYNGTYELTYIY